MIERYNLGRPWQRRSPSDRGIGCPITSIRQYRPNDQFKPEYIAIQSEFTEPGDHGSEGPGGTDQFCESGAILIISADPPESFLSRDPAGVLSRRRMADVFRWVVGPISSMRSISCPGEEPILRCRALHHGDAAALRGEEWAAG